MLRPGDTISVGDFEIRFGDDEQSSDREALATVFLDRAPVGGPTAATVLFGGAPVKIEGAVFTIGKGPSATLKISGFFMRPVQATIIRETSGTYKLFETKGGREVRLDGNRIAQSGAVLSSGNRITVGKHELTFLLTDG